MNVLLDQARDAVMAARPIIAGPEATEKCTCPR
jgi:hypothetical protein